MERSYWSAYSTYQDLLTQGIAREVARAVLPVATYSSMYATCNPRSLMHFLSLRTKDDGATFPSFPQREIEMAAEQMEALFEEHFPITYVAWIKNGRVAP
jgi:thymidylate synthase (FAD)